MGDYRRGWIAGFQGRVQGKFLRESSEWWRGYHMGRARCPWRRPA